MRCWCSWKHYRAPLFSRRIIPVTPLQKLKCGRSLKVGHLPSKQTAKAKRVRFPSPAPKIRKDYMKDVVKFLTALFFAFGPAALVVWLLFGKLAHAIITAIPSGQFHDLLSVLTYVVIALFGGIELPFVILMLSFMIVGAFISESNPSVRSKRRY